MSAKGYSSFHVLGYGFQTGLITGETGVGKKKVVKYIHQKHSARSKKFFIAVNCGVIPENLVESELFGYGKGSFTGVRQDGKMGLLEVADQRTIFLGEVRELPMEIQVKLFLDKELHRQLVKREVLHADETTLQGLHEPVKKAQAKSYMWLYRTGQGDGPPIVLYEYQPSRKAEHAEKFLEGFSGHPHADGYQGYHKLLENIQVVGCWAHCPEEVR